jgi:putrescine transport system permease protein
MLKKWLHSLFLASHEDDEKLSRGEKIVAFIPFFWLIVCFLIPFLIVLKISFSEAIIAKPPFSPLVEFLDNAYVQIRITFMNYIDIFDDSLFRIAYFNSIKIATFSTLICLLVGYPLAYAISQVTIRWRVYLLMLVVLPFWTSFLVRVYAWIGLLKPQGLINTFLMNIGLIQEPLPLLHNEFAVYLGIVYTYLPFMVLPIYANLVKLDTALLEAAADLGCKPWKSFLKITLPLSMTGVIAGSTLVFIPAIGEFIIPDLLGGPETLMIGKVLWSEFFLSRDWPLASALATITLIIVLIPMTILQRLQSHIEGKHNS